MNARSLLTKATPWSADVALLALRLWFGLAMAGAHGLGKMKSLATFTAKVGEKGVPFPEILGPAAALSEFGGGLLIALGLLTRPAATFAAITMVVAAFHIHALDPFAKKELALSYAVAYLVILVAGPGRFSIDHRWLART